MRPILLISFLVSLTSPLLAQWHDNTWWMPVPYNPPLNNFNGGAFLSFSGNEPEITTNNTYYPCNYTTVSFSDSSGQLIFYSNGLRIYNKNNQLMQNGDSLNYDPNFWANYLSSGQPNLRTIIVIPLPGNKYVLLHLKLSFYPCQPFDTRADLLKTVIDMNANNGLGRVISKNQVVKNCAEGGFTGLTATRHANGRDWWVVATFVGYRKLYLFLVTPDGIQNETIQENDGVLMWGEDGENLFSPDGRHLIICRRYEPIRVYKFDRCSGYLGKYQPLQYDTTFGYGAAVSPNSRYLYINSYYHLVQYDLFADSIAATADTLLTYDGYSEHQPIYRSLFGPSQLFPNGKIYNIAPGNGVQSTHVINFPNRYGAACQAIQRGYPTPFQMSATMPVFLNYRLGPIDGSSCDTLGIDNLPLARFRWDVEDTLQLLQVTFSDLSSYEPTQWHWTFGDGGASQDTSPVHTYLAPGTYTVCLVVSNAYAADTMCREVVVGEVSSTAQPLPVQPLAQVSPNPFAETLRVQLPARVPGVAPRLTLYDPYGRQVLAADLPEFDHRIATTALPRGIYFWQISWRGRVQQSGKVVKVE